MSAPAQALGNPPLKNVWTAAKKKSEEAAAKAKPPETSKLAELRKTKMKADFGSALDAWPKNFPKWDKLSSAKTTIDNTIKTYTDAIKASALSDAVKNPMLEALKSIKESMAKRLAQAETLLPDDAAVKASKAQSSAPVHWKAVSFNLAASLKDRDVKTILTVPDTLLIEVTAEVDGDLFEEMEKDGARAGRIQESAKKKADKAVDEMIKAMEAIVASKPTDKAAAEKAGKALYDQFHTSLEKAGKEVNAEVEKQLEDFKKGQKRLLNSRIKSVGKITITGTCMVAAVAISAASHGAFTPIAAVGIARGGIAIAQECAALASSCDTVAALVKVQIAALKVILEQDLKDPSVATKAKETGKAIGLGVLAGISGFRGIPSMENLNKNIGLHETNIGKLDLKSHENAKKLTAAMTAQEEWKKTNAAALKALPPDKASKVKGKIAKVDEQVGKLVALVSRVNEAANRAHANQKLFVETRDAMMQGLPSWIKLVDSVASLALDVGLSIGDASSVVDGAATVMLACEQEILGA